MNREPCPRCGSHSGLGDFLCFKCGHHTIMWRSHHIDHLTPPSSVNIPTPDGVVFNTTKFHPDALEWLYKFRIYSNLIRKQHIGYIPDSHRVFIPYIVDNGLVWYQTRALDKEENIKYLTVGSSKDNPIWYDIHPERRVVITEDHVSGIRVREAGYNVIVLSGTSVSDRILKEIIEEYTDIIFWLDPDGPGQNATYKLADRLSKISLISAQRAMWTGENEFYTILTRKVDKNSAIYDPKCYSGIEIQNILKNNLISWSE